MSRQISSDKTRHVPGDLLRITQELEVVRNDLRRESGGEETIFCVDNSEVQGYFGFDAKLEHTLQMGLSNQDPLLREIYAVVSLHCIFNYLSKRIYILPPHVEEVWSFFRYTLRSGSNKTAYDALAGDAAFKKVLEIADSARQENWDDGRTLTAFVEVVREGFGDQLAALDQFVRDVRSKSGIKEFGHLIESDRVSTDITRISQEFGDLFLDRLDLQHETVAKILDFIDQGRSQRRNINLRRDVECIVALRELNRKLVGKAKVVLITRDDKMRRIAEMIREEEWFGWSDVTTVLRSVEYVLFRMVAQGFDSIDEGVAWLEQSRRYLGNALMELTQHLLTSDASDELANRQGHRLSEEAAKLLERQINLRLPAAVPKIRREEIEKYLAFGSSSKDQKDTSRSTVASLSRLAFFWGFVEKGVDARDFQEAGDRLWAKMANQVIVHLLRPKLGEAGCDAVLRYFGNRSRSFPAAGIGTTEQRQVTYTFADEVRFRVKAFQEVALRYPIGSPGHQAMRAEFQTAVWRLLDTGEDSEGYLFLAWILSVSEMANEGLALASTALSLALTKGELGSNIAEYHYLNAILCRKVAVRETRKQARLEWNGFWRGLSHIANCLSIHPTDPRFVHQQSKIYCSILLEQMRLSEGVDGDYKIPKLVEGKIVGGANWDSEFEILRRLLQEGSLNAVLRTEVLNTLAFCMLCRIEGKGFGNHSSADLEEIDRYVCEIRSLTGFGGSGRNIGHVPLSVSVLDTVLWYDGVAARLSGDIGALAEAMRQYNDAILDAYLPTDVGAEPVFIGIHRRQLLHWIEDLRMRDRKMNSLVP